MKSPSIKACKFRVCPLCFKDAGWHLWRWATFAERPNSRNSVRSHNALICHCPICQAGPRRKPLRHRVQNYTPGAKGQKLSCPRLIRVWLHTGLRKKKKKLVRSLFNFRPSSFQISKRTRTFRQLCFPSFLRVIYGWPLITIFRNMRKYRWQTDVCLFLGHMAYFLFPSFSFLNRQTAAKSQDNWWGQIDCKFNVGFAASVHQSECRFHPCLSRLMYNIYTVSESHVAVTQWLPSVVCIDRTNRFLLNHNASNTNKMLKRSQTVKRHQFYFPSFNTKNMYESRIIAWICL